jgi:hypothetical protein
MAEKHKSKYKKPENKKPTYRKDIKDYTMDDKDGKMNPKSAGEKIPNLLRKTDKEVVDNGNLVPKYEADDRLYKDLEDGEYDPKTALKRLKKRQDAEEKDVKDVLKDKIENLTREQKERLVREYIRRKIAKVLNEQADTEESPEATEPEPSAPAEAPATDAAAAPTPTASPAPAPTDATAPAETPTETPTETPEADAEATPDAVEKELDPEAKEALAIERFVDHLKTETGNIARIKTISKVINSTMREAEPEDYTNFYELLRSLAINKLSTGQKTKK